MDTAGAGDGSSETEPIREPLQFDVDLDGLSPEMSEVVTSIQKLAETLLFHWKKFPIILPHSITEKRAEATTSESGDYEGVVQFKDLFVAPTFDELDAVAMDASGKLKKLNKEQLKMISKNGEFDVASLNFPGQKHRWRLSRLLQKGSAQSQDSLLGDLAQSLSIIIITARNRICSHFFSMSEAVKGWSNGLWNLIDIIIGLPSTTPGDVGKKLHEERMRYLVAELDIKPNMKRELNAYCAYVKAQCMLKQANKYKTTDLRPPPIPYRYQTPKGQDIDLRLFNKDLMNNTMGILSNILDRQSRGWHVQMRAKLIRHFQGQDMSNEEISKRVSEEILMHYLDKVYAAISSNAELEVLQPGLGDLLVSQAKSVLAMKKAQENLEQKMEMHKLQLMNHLTKAYPIKSRINTWVNEQMCAFERDFVRQNLWTAHEDAISLCEDEGLEQTVYFLRRDLNFIKERETVLRKELGRVKIPTREFKFSTRIWFPRNWVVRRVNNMWKSELIPTVIQRKEPTDKISSDPDVSYSVQKDVNRVTTTRYPFWRWWNYLHRTWSATWNLTFLFGILIPWCSIFSLRALIWPTSFVPDLDQSQKDGSLYPRESSRTETLLSRLRALWAHVKKSRADFEAKPDRGFLGKSMTRHFNRLWNYVLKGAIGSVSLVLVFPVLCVAVSGLSVVAAVLTPVWVPLMTLLGHICFFLIWDKDSPRSKKNRFFIIFEALVWNLLLQGCLQPISAFLVCALACPIGALAVLLFGFLRYCSRRFWDLVMFQVVIKSRGRVPSSDGFVARRIAGPGLASNYFFQIRPEQALAAMEASLEQEELQAWRQNMLDIIEQPKQAFREFVEKCFRPFSATLIEKGVFSRLNVESNKYTKDVNFVVNGRSAKLYTGLSPDLQRRIKLAEEDLKLTIVYTAKLLEEFYPDHVIKRKGLTEEEFWEAKGLEFKDWRGLAFKKLREVFSPHFLVPLEETDNYFQLKVNHMNVQRYAEMLSTARFHDDLDVVIEIHTPEGDIEVSAPYLDVQSFDPRKKMNVGSSRPLALKSGRCTWSDDQAAASFDKMQVPLPIPHPANIAIAVYNRENDQDPIDLEAGSCQQVVRATKETPLRNKED